MEKRSRSRKLAEKKQSDREDQFDNESEMEKRLRLRKLAEMKQSNRGGEKIHQE